MTPLVPGFSDEDIKVHELTLAGRTIRVCAPSSVKALPPLADPVFEAERRMPYWARVWPGGALLAQHMLAHRLSATRAIELGCGLGLAGVAAGLAGARVLHTDAHEVALVFAAANARRNGVGEHEAARLDWREGLVDDELRGQFSLVLGGEVVYEASAVPALFQCIHALLAPGGVAWIADPLRLGLERVFLDAAAADLDARLEGTFPHPPGIEPVDGAPARELHLVRLRSRHVERVPG